MFFAICKWTFEEEVQPRDLHSLVKKIQTRFPVCIRTSKDEPGVIVIASLGDKENLVSRQLDEIAAFAESFGIGRIASETALLDHIDTIDEGELGE